MPIDNEFINDVKKLVLTLGTQLRVGKLCGVEVSAISKIIHSKIQSVPKPLHRRLIMLIGKSKEEIKAIEDKMLEDIKKENEIQRKKRIEEKSTNR